VLAEFRSQLESDGDYSLEEWGGFLGEIQRDQRLTFFRN
jgi:hypothetical protein